MSLKTRIQRLEQHVNAEGLSDRQRYLMTLSDEELEKRIDEILENMLLNGESLAPEFMSQEEWAEVMREHRERVSG